jgi:hypothetical protein
VNALVYLGGEGHQVAITHFQQLDLVLASTFAVLQITLSLDQLLLKFQKLLSLLEH